MANKELIALADDISATARKVETFAKSLTGYQADQSFAPCIQIMGAFDDLAERIRARAQVKP